MRKRKLQVEESASLEAETLIDNELGTLREIKHPTSHSIGKWIGGIISISIVVGFITGYFVGHLTFHDKSISTMLIDRDVTISTNIDSNTAIIPKYSILPKKIYTVVGLESSGTTFIARTLASSLGLKGIREGSFPCTHKYSSCSENEDIQVQHFSLPWGGTCADTPHSKVVDVVLPSQCTRSRRKSPSTETTQCSIMAQELSGLEINNASYAMQYPIRYQLNLTSQKEWYDAQGVEQYYVIVVRDKTISSIARSAVHCSNLTLLEKEEEIGLGIIENVVKKYILEDYGNKNRTDWKNTRSLFGNPQETFEINDLSRMLRSVSLSPSGNNVVVMSYESMVTLGESYIRMLYNSLGIESDYIPEIRNSNRRYINGTLD